MKLLSVLPLAVLGSSLVIPDDAVMSSIAIEEPSRDFTPIQEEIPSPQELWEDVKHPVIKALGCAKHKLNDAVDYALQEGSNFGTTFEEAFDYQSWINSAEDKLEGFVESPKHPEDKPPHHPPHHSPHHHKPNETVYQLISKSKYTTILAKLIDDYPDLVELLNGTTANYTVFAPTDKAFKKIPKHAPLPSKEDLKNILTYHISSDFYPAGRVLTSRTIPTLYKSSALGDEPQRLSTQLSLKGLTIGFYSKVVAVDIFGTNGVIHGVDSVLHLPPMALDILRLLPGEFSTLDLALLKTGLGAKLNDTSLHTGGTIFAPSNTAFKKLGPRINAFLFSKHGEKYLKALLKYHHVPNYTLYSDAFYKADEFETDGSHSIPKGHYHVDLPTALEEKFISIDIGRFGRLIDIRINGFNHVAISNGIAKDGVIHVLNSILIPPKKPGVLEESEGELTLEAFKASLEPLLEDGEEWAIDL